MTRILLLSLLCFGILSAQESKTAKEVWQELAFETQGCILGQQYDHDREPREFERFIFNSSLWLDLKKKDTKELTEFLITQMADTTKTNWHTCPFWGATNGELAVYALQKIHGVNWFDFEPYSEYKTRDYESASEQPQAWLQRLLADDKERERLASLFRSY